MQSLSELGEEAEGVRETHLLDGLAVGVQQPRAGDEVRAALRARDRDVEPIPQKRKSRPREALSRSRRESLPLASTNFNGLERLPYRAKSAAVLTPCLAPCQTRGVSDQGEKP